MPRINSYPNDATPAVEDVLIIDGTEGTRTLSVSQLRENILDPAQLTPLPLESVTDSTKIIADGKSVTVKDITDYVISKITPAEGASF